MNGGDESLWRNGLVSYEYHVAVWSVWTAQVMMNMTGNRESHGATDSVAAVVVAVVRRVDRRWPARCCCRCCSWPSCRCTERAGRCAASHPAAWRCHTYDSTRTTCCLVLHVKLHTVQHRRRQVYVDFPPPFRRKMEWKHDTASNDSNYLWITWKGDSLTCYKNW